MEQSNGLRLFREAWLAEAKWHYEGNPQASLPP
jgi:hypothetical protein